MQRDSHNFIPRRPVQHTFTWGDMVVLITVAVLIYVGIRLALSAPVIIKGPTISLEPSALPFYASLSIVRMVIAYILSLLFTVVFEDIAAYNLNA